MENENEIKKELIKRKMKPTKIIEIKEKEINKKDLSKRKKKPIEKIEKK